MTRISRADKKKKILDKILLHGTKLFIESGNQMSMSELSKLVGFKGISSLYRHIHSKRDLWYMVNLHIGDKIIKKINEIRMNPLLTLESQFFEIINYILDFSSSNFMEFYLMVYLFPQNTQIKTK